MIYLESFKVEQFRGIKDLDVKELGNINIIVGDNNSGKTSVLESIMLLRNTKEFSNILNVMRLRDNNFYSPFRVGTFDNFLYMFNPVDVEKVIAVEANLCGKNVKMKMQGIVEDVLIDYNELNDRVRKSHGNPEAEIIYEESEMSEFHGNMISYINDEITVTNEVKFNSYVRLTGMKSSEPEFVQIVYVSPTQHTSGNVFSQIIKNDSYKNIVLKVIQIFDKDIEDILYLKNEQTSRPIECIKHAKLGIMPLSTYGDGIKKVLLLANSIAKAANGILLVDEIETAVHAKYYDDIFKFVIKACIQFNIQLFATTHNIEAVDGFLATQYDENKDMYDESGKDLLRVITFRKNSEKNKTSARVLKGKEVFDNRNNFGFEVRI